MDRGLAVGNKLCARREEERRHALHQERVRKMKPMVDTTTPRVAAMDHVRNNLKKEQMLEERYSEIDRENRILLKKMSDVMRQPATGTGPSPGPTSLNRDFRKKELLKITKENQTILTRIQQAQPIYNHILWEGNHRRNENYLHNCCEYPLVLRSARRREGPSSELAVMASEEPAPTTVMPEQPSSSASGGVRLPPAAGASQPEEDQRVVLKQGARIGEAYYMVEMTTDGRSLVISAFDGAQATLELVVKEKIHRRLYRETNGDYSVVASWLRIVDDNRLILEEPSPEEVISPTQSGSLEQRKCASEEINADDMIVMHAKSGSAGSVNAEIDLGASQPRVHIRGLTPLTGAESPRSRSPET